MTRSRGRTWECFRDGDVFRAAVTPFLMRDEARNNLLLGLAGRFGSPGEPGTAVGFAGRDGEGAMAAATLRSDGRGLVVGDASGALMHALADELASGDLADDGVVLPAAHGPEPAIDAFLERWCARTGARAETPMRQRLHRLDAVRDPAFLSASGAMRAADERDRALADRWTQAFCAEAKTPAPPPGTVRALDEKRLFVWDDAGPVASAAWSRPTPNGCTIGLVYTPPEHRSRGYATALVAALSQRMLAGGKAFCTLFTDVTNPTSNRIYARIGYVPIADYRRVRLSAPGPAAGK